MHHPIYCTEGESDKKAPNLTRVKGKKISTSQETGTRDATSVSEPPLTATVKARSKSKSAKNQKECRDFFSNFDSKFKRNEEEARATLERLAKR